ncbi:AAA family ATPase, partial [bacterium]|nr:AAA family ATPase [bacterium]
DFKNTVIIMTSNIGAREITGGKSLGFLTVQEVEQTYKDMKKKVLDEMKKVFRPEFLNRIDEAVVFHPLSKEDVRNIVDLMLQKVTQRLSEQGVTLEVSDGAKEFLVIKGFDPQFGARPLRRAIQKYLEDPLAQEILAKKIKPQTKVTADVLEDKIVFKLLSS